jgi:hypothetical protein
MIPQIGIFAKRNLQYLIEIYISLFITESHYYDQPYKSGALGIPVIMAIGVMIVYFNRKSM